MGPKARVTTSAGNACRAQTIVLAALILGAPRVRDADAAPTDTQKCQAKKLGAAGRYTHCRITAEATYIKKSCTLQIIRRGEWRDGVRP